MIEFKRNVLQIPKITTLIQVFFPKKHNVISENCCTTPSCDNTTDENFVRSLTEDKLM